MICPRCQFQFDASGARVQSACPDCGMRVVQSVTGMVKTSAVLISARGRRDFYRSVQEVPEPLRTELLEVTTSRNAGTIVIADKAGRERLEMERALAARPPQPAPQPPSEWLGVPWVVWAGVGLALGAASVIAALFSPRW